MIKTVKPKRGNHIQVEYEKTFASKFDLVKNIPNYKALENFAQKCIDLLLSASINGINARSCMDRIIEMDDKEFIEWAKEYIHNNKK